MVDVPAELPGVEKVEQLEQPIDIPDPDLDMKIAEYVPKGHTFTIYTGEELVAVIAMAVGGALAAYAIIWLLMRVLGGGHHE